MLTKTTPLVKKLSFILLPMFLFSVITACGGGANSSQLNVGTGQLIVEFPVSLTKHLTENMEIKAQLTVDGTDVYSLQVDRESESVTGTIQNISNGEHTLVVEYIIFEQGVDISIAKGTILINVGDREIIAITYNKFIYNDDDGDGITNIAELEMGTNYLDIASVPPSHGLHGSSLYAIKDKTIGDNAVIGTVNSPKYNIR